MRLAVPLALVACGGSSPPPTPPPKPAEPPRATRVVTEDDSEPEDGVEIVNARGRMDPAAVEAGLAPYTASMSECFTSRVGRRRWLGGHIMLHWDIKKTGEITAVKLAESDLGAWPIEKCLLEIAKTATFANPIGGDADFQLPLDFKSTGSSLTWDDDQALKAVGGQLSTLDDCNDGEPGDGKEKEKPKRKKVPKGAKAPKTPKAPPAPKAPPKRVRLPNDVTVTIYVGTQGKAQSVGFSSAASILEDDWADCAEKTVLAWRLPDPRGTIAKLAIRYRPR